jgi:hypothetical protein
VSFGHSPPTRGEPGPGFAVQSETDSGEAAAKVLEPSLAEDVVPMRATAERELDRDREERVRAVVAGRRRALPRPSSRGLALGAIGLAATLLVLALNTTLGSGGGNPHSPSQAVTPQHRGSNSAFHRQLHADAQSLRRSRAVAHTRRRAAIRAKREAARRRAKRRSARKLAAHRTERAQRSARQELPASAEDSSAEAQAPAAVASTPPAPTSTQSSTGSSQTQREFGFER